MRFTWLIVGLLPLLFLPAHAGHSPPKIFMRVYVQTNEGLPPSEAQPLVIPPNNEVIQVRTLPEVTEGDLLGVEADASGSVHFRFNRRGLVNLDAVTAQNQGRLLIVMIDATIIYAPVIDEQITNGELIIPHPLNPEVLKLLQEVARKNLAEANHT
jgi:preprotein translocase subunit SecD